MSEKEKPTNICEDGDRESPRFFTAEDVAHMTAADVRDHYHDIMESMKNW